MRLWLYFITILRIEVFPIVRSLEVLGDGSERVPYNDPGLPVYAGSSWLRAYPGMGSLYHWHDDLEFGTVLHGHVSYDINGQTVTVQEGEGIFINSRQMHRSYSADGTDGAYRCVLFHPSLLLGRDPTIDQSVERLTGNENFAFQTLDAAALWQKRLLDAVEGLYRLIADDKERKMVGIWARVFDIADLLLEAMPPNDNQAAPDRRIPALRDMVGLIQRCYAKKITLADICRAGSVGTSTGSALFRKHFGLSPLAYLMQYRLEKAAQLLGNPGLSITEIAYATGFSGSSYFSECFRNRYGISPVRE